MRIPAALSILTLFAVLLALPTAALADPAEQYLHARHAVAAPVYTGGQLALAQSERLASSGQVYEITARVSGRIGSDSAQMLILDMQGVSLEVAPPASLGSDTPWLDSGSSVRVLMQANGQTTQDQDPYQVLAIAPEGSVKDLEARYAQAHPPRAQLTPTRAVYETSRSAIVSHRTLGGGQPIAPLSDNALRIYAPYRAMIAGLNPRLSAHEIDTITTSILYYSDYYRIDPRLIIAMIVAESGFDPHCTSHTGAMGLGQIMPGTAAGLGVTDAYDPVQNIGAAVHILSGHVQQYGGVAPYGAIPLNTLLLTMAAYNAGSGAVKKYGGVPPYRETQAYVRRVNRLYRQLCGG